MLHAIEAAGIITTIIVLALYALQFVGRRILRAAPESEVIYICRPCLERLYFNTWMGFKTSRRACNVCHQAKMVDRLPLMFLRPRSGEDE